MINLSGASRWFWLWPLIAGAIGYAMSEAFLVKALPPLAASMLVSSAANLVVAFSAAVFATAIEVLEETAKYFVISTGVFFAGFLLLAFEQDTRFSVNLVISFVLATTVSYYLVIVVVISKVTRTLDHAKAGYRRDQTRFHLDMEEVGIAFGALGQAGLIGLCLVAVVLIALSSFGFSFGVMQARWPIAVLFSILVGSACVVVLKAAELSTEILDA